MARLGRLRDRQARDLVPAAYLKTGEHVSLHRAEALIRGGLERPETMVRVSQRASVLRWRGWWYVAALLRSGGIRRLLVRSRTKVEAVRLAEEVR